MTKYIFLFLLIASQCFSQGYVQPGSGGVATARIEAVEAYTNVAQTAHGWGNHSAAGYAYAQDWSSFTNAGRWVPCERTLISGAAETSGSSEVGTGLTGLRFTNVNQRANYAVPDGTRALRILGYMETNSATAADGHNIAIRLIYLNTGGTTTELVKQATYMATNQWFAATNVFNSAALESPLKVARVQAYGTNFTTVATHTNAVPFWLYKIEAYVPNCFGESCPAE